MKSSQDFTLRLLPPSKGESGSPATLSGSNSGRFERLTRSSLRLCRRSFDYKPRPAVSPLLEMTPERKGRLRKRCRGAVCF